MTSTIIRLRQVLPFLPVVLPPTHPDYDEGDAVSAGEARREILAIVGCSYDEYDDAREVIGVLPGDWCLERAEEYLAAKDEGFAAIMVHTGREKVEADLEQMQERVVVRGDPDEDSDEEYEEVEEEVEVEDEDDVLIVTVCFFGSRRGPRKD